MNQCFRVGNFICSFRFRGVYNVYDSNRQKLGTIECNKVDLKESLILEKLGEIRSFAEYIIARDNMRKKLLKNSEKIIDEMANMLEFSTLEKAVFEEHFVKKMLHNTTY